jgi:flagellar hook capping protein FlgD
MTKRLNCLKSIFLLTFMLTCNIFGQITLNVPSTYPTITSAIAVASNGDIIQVNDGTYSENIVIPVGIALQSTNGAALTIIEGNITIAADNVVIDDFTVTNPSGKNAILVTDFSHITIKNNIINYVGTTDVTTSGTNIGIMVVSSSLAVDDITIENNTISNIMGGFKKSADAIAIGWSNGNADITNLLIQNNTISDITSDTADFSLGGRGAYGIILNHASPSYSGKTDSPHILNNTISNLEGHWVHGIGLEGATPNALVQGNTFNNFTTTKPFDNFAIFFEANPDLGTVILSQNKVETSRGLGIHSDLLATLTTEVVDATNNWWGDASGPSGTDLAGTGAVFGTNVSDASIVAHVTYSPWLADASGLTNGYNTDPNDPASLGNVLASVSPGDVIIMNGGTYSAVSLATDGITLIGNGATINNGSPAIIVNSNNVTITGFSFSFGTADFAIDVQSGTNITINECDFLTTNGVVNNGTGTVNAVDNFWGSLTGPAIASNPSGSGSVASNASTGSLDYFPWWSDLTHTTHTKLPYLSNPINGLTGVSVEPTFTWGAWTDVTSYELVIDDNSDFSSPIYQEDQGLLLTKSMTEEIANFPLDNNTLYYWKVVMDVGGTDYDSDSYHFKTIPAVPITKSLPLDLSTVNMTDVTFYWFISGLSGSMKYKIQVKESLLTPIAAEWATPDFEEITLVPNKLFSLIEGVKYYWRVILLTAGDEVINYSSTWSFTTGGGVSITPIPSWPVGGTIVQTNTPTLYWYTSAFAGAAEYQVKYSTDAGLTGLELTSGDKYPDDGDMDINGSTNLFLTLPLLDAGETYYWQARTYDATTFEYGPWSVVESFVTNGTGTLVKPTLSYPTGGVTQYTTAPTLYWYIGALGSGLTYDVYYREVGGVFNAVAEHQSADLSFQLLDLEVGKTYEWYVAANNSSDTSQSNTETFTITGGVANGYPVITWPVSNPTMYTTKPTINWFIEGSSLGLADVVLRYKEGTTTSNGTVYDAEVEIPLPSNLYTLTVDLNEGSTYFFALAAKDAGGNYSVWDEDSFTIYNAADNIGDPVLTAPIGGLSLAYDDPTLYWYVVGDQTAIASFEVSYSTSDVFASPTIVSGVLDPFLALSGLTPGATYYWKVRTLYTNASYSNYSTTETFVITLGGFAIQPLVGGPNNVVVNTTTPTISWVFTADHSPTLKSELLISDNPDMMNAITIENIESSKYDVSNLEIGKSYFWRVRTKTVDNSYSEYSGQGNFKIGDNITDIAEPIIIPEKFNVSQNYPNPFNPTTIINYSLPESEFVTIRVYNMLGQEIAILLNEEVNAGVYNVTWNGVDNSGVKVATGTYIYRVVAGSNIITKKMMLLK